MIGGSRHDHPPDLVMKKVMTAKRRYLSLHPLLKSVISSRYSPEDRELPSKKNATP